VTPRAQEILFSITRAFIETGEPQGSRTISRALDSSKSAPSLSPASIRNIMADLTDEGYLSQPHTSAGHVPTEKAFRAFVARLSNRPLPAVDTEGLSARFVGIVSLEAGIARTSQILTELTRVVGIAAAVRTGGQELDRVELIGLSDKRVLIIVITRDGNVSNQVVALDEQLSSADLESIRNYINLNFSGWHLEQARREIERRLDQERAAYDQILKRINLLHEKGLLAEDRASHVHMEGASNLVGLDLHLTRERMRDLFRALEEKKRVAELLDRFLEASGGLGVQIGLGDAHPSMKELALIGVTLTLPGGLLTRVAVLGPMRMNYGRVIATVLGVSRAFEKSRAA
jgi:heat-inducible transcriptional repressor